MVKLIPMPSANEDYGPSNVRESYQWAKRFMSKMHKLLGNYLLTERLAEWRWSLSTAFSGVGCAESATTSDCVFILAGKLFDTSKLRMALFAQAAMCLSTAASPYCSSSRQPVLLSWGVENNRACQEAPCSQV